MPPFEVVYDPKFRKGLKKVRKSGRMDVVREVLRGVELLGQDPLRPRSELDILPLRSYPAYSFRLRLGDYRVLYHVDFESKTVTLIEIFHRERGYRP